MSMRAFVCMRASAWDFVKISGYCTPYMRSHFISVLKFRSQSSFSDIYLRSYNDVVRFVCVFSMTGR